MRRFSRVLFALTILLCSTAGAEEETVDTFARVLEKPKGPVLLHCTVAWRASYMWTAYLVLYHDVPLEEALARGEAIAISPPHLEGLLGRYLTLAYED